MAAGGVAEIVVKTLAATNTAGIARGALDPGIGEGFDLVGLGIPVVALRHDFCGLMVVVRQEERDDSDEGLVVKFKRGLGRN